MKAKTLKVQYLDNYKGDPLEKSKEDSGFDLRAAIDSLVEIWPMERVFVKLGVRVEIPLGYEVQIRPRSGSAKKDGIMVVNSPGTVDSGYTGEWGVILYNSGQRPFVINPGDRVCQGVLQEVPHVVFEEVSEISETIRGSLGFGSSGIQ